MLSKLMKLNKNQKGITGLETAIILIAFVVVASVFAYTVLSAGLFSTQKSQEAVYNGLSEASSTMQISGGVTAYQGSGALTDASSVGKVSFMLTLASSTADPIDLTPTDTYAAPDLTTFADSSSPTQISYTDKNVTVPSCDWTLAWVGTNNGDNLLDKNEKAVVTVWLHDHQAGAWADGGTGFLGTNGVDAYSTFTLEVKPAKGAVLNLTRTMPASLTPTMDLH